MGHNPESAVVKRIIAERAWGERPLAVIDVGASGGIDPSWDAFQPLVAAIGFDALATEVARLMEADKRTYVRYEAAFVGAHGGRSVPPPMNQVRVDPYLRTSAERAQELLAQNYVQDQFNAGATVVWSETHLTLDDRFDSVEPLDVLKIDTDGADLQVLYGAERLLRDGAWLAIEIETQFQGWPHPDANVFGNIDRVLRNAGFSLWDLNTYRISRAALPGRFVHPIPAQTHGGQVTFADALFVRDLAHPAYQKLWNYDVTPEKIIKLVALFDVYGFPDCAAELIQAFPAALPRQLSREILDLLVVSAGGAGSYESYIRRFDANPREWMPATVENVPSADASEQPPSLGVESLSANAQSEWDARPALSPRAAYEALESYRRRLEEAEEQIRLLRSRVRAWRLKVQERDRTRARRGTNSDPEPTLNQG